MLKTSELYKKSSSYETSAFVVVVLYVINVVLGIIFFFLFGGSSLLRIGGVAWIIVFVILAIVVGLGFCVCKFLYWWLSGVSVALFYLAQLTEKVETIEKLGGFDKMMTDYSEEEASKLTIPQASFLQRLRNP